MVLRADLRPVRGVAKLRVGWTFPYRSEGILKRQAVNTHKHLAAGYTKATNHIPNLCGLILVGLKAVTLGGNE